MTSYDDETLIACLLRGDEDAFEWIVRRYQHRLMRVARIYVRSEASAADVVQDTWMAVLRGLATFERRSSIGTWMFHIAANRARTRAVRDGRLVSFEGSVGGRAEGIDDSRFDPSGAWREPVSHWPMDDPERFAINEDVRRQVLAAIDDLPPGQRAVIVLRDIEGLTAAEACNILSITETNQRVLLHRARVRLRAALADSQMPPR